MPAIENVARAIFGQLSSALGARATAVAPVLATIPSGAVLPRNTYFVPVVDGRLMEHWLFKVAANPATLAQDGSGGDWPLDTVTPRNVALVSNLGGARYNLPAGTVFRIAEDPIANVPETITTSAPATGGADGVVRDAHFFEDLTPSQQQADIFGARLGTFPALVLVWESSDPADGLTTGVGQGQTRAGRGKRFFRESFSLFVVSSSQASDTSRRSLGLRIMEACTELLTDHVSNVDGEPLSTLGGLKVLTRARVARSASAYVYAVRFSVTRTWKASEARTFSPWDFSRVVGELPGHAAPEPTAVLPIPDVKVSMLGDWTTSAGAPWSTSTNRPWRT